MIKPKVERQINVIADAPSRIDLLGNSSYVNALFNIITAKNTVTPFNIGILGEWGTGKSTMMMQLASKLSNNNYPVVVFNPWKYDGKEEIWYALIQTILMTFEDSVDKETFKASVLDFVKGIGTMVASKAISHYTNDTIDLDKLLDAYTKMSEKNIKFINEFETSFAKLVDKYSEDRKLIIFIDDLDRCLPDSIIKVLEAIKLFLSVPKCIFIIGIENNVVQEAIRLRYSDNFNFSGKDYLEKIIQLSFTIPNSSDSNIANFINLIAGDELNEKLKKLIAVGCNYNPRKIKRFINSYNLIKAVNEEELFTKQRENNLNDEILAFVLILQMRYPKIYEYYMNNPRDCNQILELLENGKIYDREGIERLETTNPIYAKMLSAIKFNQFARKVSQLSMNFKLGDEGLLEYFSAAKTISTEGGDINRYFLPQLTKNGGLFRFNPNEPAYNGVKNVFLVRVGNAKLKTVKELKIIKGIGLREAKDLIDNIHLEPVLLAENAPIELQRELKKTFEDFGQGNQVLSK